MPTTTIAETLYINAGTTYSTATTDSAPASDAVARSIHAIRQTADSAPASDAVTATYLLAARIDPTSIPSAESVPAPFVYIPGSIFPTSIASAESVPQPVVRLAQQYLSPTSIPTAQSFGTPVVGSFVFTDVGNIATGEVVGTPAVSLTVSISSSIASGEALGTPRLNLRIFGTAIGTAEAFGIAAVSAPLQIRPTSIETEEAFGSSLRIVRSSEVVFISTVPPYRVVITDLSDNAIEEVPFKNLQFTYALNDAGSCSFTLPILHEKCTKSLLDPGKRNVQVWREGVLVWAGRLWFANPTTGDSEVRFSAEGWFSILRRRFIDAEHFRINTDQLAIAWSLINFTQTKTVGGVSGNIGITRANPAEVSGVLRTRKYHAWERYNIADELVNLTEINNGFDFEITPAKSWITHFPQKGTDTSIVFELGKNIGNLSQSYDAANVATEFTALGAGDRNRRCIATVSDASQLAAFGILEANEAYSGIKHYDTLAAKAVGQLDVLKRLKRNPQLSVTTDEPEFTDYAPGDRVRVKANYGYLQVDELFRVTAQSIQIADSGRESQTVFMEETTV